MDTKLGAITLDDLIDELARVLHEAESARVLVLRASFPAADLPAFDVPRVFWSRVIRAATDGMLVGGARALVDEVAKQYPGNEVFAGYRAQAVAGAGTEYPTASSPDRVEHERPTFESDRALLRKSLTDWNRRWWVLPGEVVARLGTTDLVFESDDGTLWSFMLRNRRREVRIHWDHQARGFVARGPEDLGAESAATLRTLLYMMIGHPQNWMVQGAAKHVVDTIAQAMMNDEWITGRRLRALLPMEKTDFLRIAEELQPRYVRAREGDSGDEYSLTLPGLWFSSQAPRVRRILDAIIATLKSKFHADPDVRGYSLDEVVESGGFDDDERSLIVTLVSLTGLMYGGQGARSARRFEFQWVAPREIEDIVGLRSVVDLFRFFQRHHDGFTSVRCWPTAPIGPWRSGTMDPPGRGNVDHGAGLRT